MRMLWLVVLWCPAAAFPPETRRLYNCVNDDSTSDSYGDPCSWYDGYPDYCGHYDDADFTASAQCCACGGGLVGSATPAPTLYGCAMYVAGPVVAYSGNQVATVDSLQNYELTFTMELASDWSITNKFQSVLHIGSADQDRFPNILFNPSQYGSGLVVAQSYGDCSPSFCQWYLGTGSFAAAGGTYEIKVVVENNQMTVYIDGVNRGSKSGSATYAAANAAVYVGDPWYDAAAVTLSHICLKEIVYPSPAPVIVYVDREMSWEDARAHCRANHHDLASIHSASENAEVDALCPGRCWIGGSDEAREGTWTWSDGTAWDYTNWYPGEPNDAGSGQDFLHIYGMWEGRWDDTYEHLLQPFVCSTRSRGTDEEDDDDDSDGDDSDGDDSDGDAIVVSLCVIGAFFCAAVFVGATVNKCAAKSAKVAATTGAAAVPNAATDAGDMITVEAPPGKLGLKFEGTSAIVKEVFSDSPLVGKVYPGDALKSINGMLTAGKLIHLAAAASDGTKPRTLVFVRKKQPVDLQTGATTADAADGAGTAAAAGTAQLESDLAAARDALEERDHQLEQARADADELRNEVLKVRTEATERDAAYVLALEKARADADELRKERDEARLEAQLRDTPRQATAVSVVPGGTAPAQLATVLSVRHL